MMAAPFNRYPNAFLATYLRRLADRISDASVAILRDHGIAVEPRTVSVLLFAADNTGSTTADVAQTLGISHQLASQRIARLIDQGLITTRTDPHDSRRRPIRLTRRGDREVKKILPVIARFDRVFEQLVREEAADLPDIINRVFDALSRESLAQRYERANGAATGRP